MSIRNAANASRCVYTLLTLCILIPHLVSNTRAAEVDTGHAVVQQSSCTSADSTRGHIGDTLTHPGRRLPHSTWTNGSQWTVSHEQPGLDYFVDG